MSDLRWGGDAVSLTFLIGADAPVCLTGLVASAGPASAVVGESARRYDPHADQPLVEVSAFGHGRFPGGFRHVDTVIGRRLRYESHVSETTDSGTRSLRIHQTDAETGLRTTSVFVVADGVAGFRTWTEVEATSGVLVLDFVSTFASGAVYETTGREVDGLSLVSAASDWVAESRWSTRPLRQAGLARIDRSLQHHQPRSRCVVTNRGSWSTGEALPTGVLVATDAGSGESGDPAAVAWQIEHNGPWLYELGETRAAAYLLLSGPTDQEHQWSTPIAPGGAAFVSVPASVVVGAAGGGLDGALAALTDQRRAIRLHRAADDALPVVFNDYMNTLMGDPTTEKLLPLIDAAADAGADYFCIDAGWYAEGAWWDAVGEWQPSPTRFPGGLAEATDRIRDRGMVPGLWLEPEVIGVNSPLAETLPADAFFSRQGIRVAEHGRHLLDLRNPEARAHVDAVVDRLVDDFGVGFFKMDYNTMPGPGTDSDGSAPGAGLLGHARALLDWLDDIQRRHPHLLIESCASGAMRMDYATLARLHVQSTSDQQDPVLYAPIAAAAPASILPEQAGHWAYPNPAMSDELFTLSLVNGILGRMYLSGYLNRMSGPQLALVAEAIAAHRQVLLSETSSHARWPLGLPAWDASWIALGQEDDEGMYLSLWWRGTADGVAGAVVRGGVDGAGVGVRATDAVVDIPLPDYRGRDLAVDAFFPAALGDWSARWDAAAGVLRVAVTGSAAAAASARVLRLTPRG
ncbi:glycoside hydrolase family 36 protein [Leifsonia sp. NPDC058292]|uniref:glycoside hydrolase family 36 protein n=1 Tax=Leifsonia sp. NPDC058292 TaxID=3346428 RepID=UPI0036DB02F7